MTKKQQKQIEQLREFFGINEQQYKDDHEQYKQLIAENRSQLSEEEITIAEAMIKSEGIMVDYESQYPVTEFVYSTLQQNLSDAEITKVLNFLHSDIYKKFFDVTEAAFQQYANNQIDYIDAALGDVGQAEAPRLH